MLPSVGQNVTDPCSISSYKEAYNYEIANGLAGLRDECDFEMYDRSRQLFGPATEWEAFQDVCTGPCMHYWNRLQRINRWAPNCNCSAISGVDCMPNPAELMCERTGSCVDFRAFYARYCDGAACGRLTYDENSWREFQEECGAHSVSISMATALCFVLCALWHRRGNEI